MKTSFIRGSLPSIRRQRGAAQLFITLVLLGIIMMLGITATIISSTQFRLAGNLQFESQAFDNAETAAATGLGWVTTGCNGQTFAGTSNGYLRAMPVKGAGGEVNPFGVKWDTSEAKTVDAGDTSQQYVIQMLGKVSLGADSQTGDVLGDDQKPVANQEGRVFRITTRGTSAKGTARLVQTNVYVKNDSKC